MKTEQQVRAEIIARLEKWLVNGMKIQDRLLKGAISTKQFHEEASTNTEIYFESAFHLLWVLEGCSLDWHRLIQTARENVRENSEKGSKEVNA